MTSLAPILPKLSKLVLRLASDADGKVVATVRAIERTLRDAGCNWHDLTELLAPARPMQRACPKPEPQPQRPQTWLAIANFCVLCPKAGALSPKDMAFVLEMVRMLRHGRTPSVKQTGWLLDIYAELGGERP